jgi:hypothetical protein
MLLDFDLRRTLRQTPLLGVVRVVVTVIRPTG